MESEFLFDSATEDLTDLQRRGFKLIQKKAAFRFGTDSVLLADFARPKRSDICVDIGSGTGVIATLMCARAPGTRVDCVELQSDIAEMAARSVKMNGLEGSIRVFCMDVRRAKDELGLGNYSLAVCNPPYFSGGALPGAPTVRLARHEDALTAEELCEAASKLVKFGGRLAVVYPAQRLHDMLRAMEKFGLAPKRVRTVHAKPSRAPKVALLDAVKGGGSALEWLPPLILMDESGRYTDEWRRIYG